MKKTTKRRRTTKKNKRQSKKKGFTLIELLVVSTIIVVLSVVGLVSFSGISEKARDAQRKSDIEDVRAAAMLYKIDNGTYPIASLTQRTTPVAEKTILDQLVDVVTVDQAHAALATPTGYTPPPTDEKSTPTPTPIFETAIPNPTATPVVTRIPTPTFSTAVPSPTATISAEDETIPRIGTSGGYTTAVTELESEGYLDGIPVDPKNNSTYFYTYLSTDGASFSVSALLEDGNVEYTLTN